MYVHTCYVLIRPRIPYITSSPLCMLRVFASCLNFASRESPLSVCIYNRIYVCTYACIQHSLRVRVLVRSSSVASNIAEPPAATRANWDSDSSASTQIKTFPLSLYSGKGGGRERGEERAHERDSPREQINANNTLSRTHKLSES